MSIAEETLTNVRKLFTVANPTDNELEALL